MVGETNNEVIWKQTIKALDNNDFELASDLARKLSDAGDWRGSSCLGYIIEHKARNLDPEANQLRQDSFTEAASWYSLALEQGDNYAPHYGLAAYYYYGLGGEYNFKESYKHLEHCITYVPVAKIMMAELLFQGFWVARDIVAARKLLQSAAEDGYPSGLTSLARIEWSERKPIKALIYYIRALRLAIRLFLQNQDHPLLAGVGNRRSFRLDKKVMHSDQSDKN